MNSRHVLIGAALAVLGGLVLCAPADAQTASGASSARSSQHTDITAQRRTRRQPTRVRVYRSFPGPNSLRVCNARYVQEYRPSGTVIVPVVNCYWSG